MIKMHAKAKMHMEGGGRGGHLMYPPKDVKNLVIKMQLNY